MRNNVGVAADGDDAAALGEMRHFMEHNVFKAFRRLLGKFRVEPNALGTTAVPALSGRGV
jgi:hypothetical protein